MLALTVVLLTVSGDVSGRSARLIDAPLAEPLPPASIAQLQADLAALKRERPSLGAPITLLTVGGSSALLGGLYMGINTALTSLLGFTSPIFIMGLVGLSVGTPMLVIGAWLLATRLDERRRIDEVSGELRRQLTEQQRAPRSGLTQVPPPTLELARF